MELFLIIILSVLVIILTYTTFNMLKKNEEYEDFIDLELKNNQKLLETLRRLDNKRMFEKDDEVGSLFEQIKETIIRQKNFQ